MHAHLLRPGIWNLKASLVLAFDELPADARKNSLRMRRFLEHIFDSVLAVGIAVAGNADKDARQIDYYGFGRSGDFLTHGHIPAPFLRIPGHGAALPVDTGKFP